MIHVTALHHGQGIRIAIVHRSVDATDAGRIRPARINVPKKRTKIWALRKALFPSSPASNAPSEHGERRNEAVLYIVISFKNTMSSSFREEIPDARSFSVYLILASPPRFTDIRIRRGRCKTRTRVDWKLKHNFHFRQLINVQIPRCIDIDYHLSCASASIVGRPTHMCVPAISTTSEWNLFSALCIVRTKETIHRSAQM